MMDDRNRELWRLIIEIDDYAEGLTDWEIDFIGSLIDKKPTRLSEKHEAIIQRIHGKVKR